MEIRSACKTLPAQHFEHPKGNIFSDRFTPALGETYTVRSNCEFEGHALKQGQGLKLIIKNKKHYHYKLV